MQQACDNVQRAEMGRDEMAEALREHRQKMAEYRHAHPVRATFGASYRPDAYKMTDNLASQMQERNKDVQQCREHVLALGQDSNLLRQADNGADQYNANIDKARQDVPDFEQELSKRLLQQEHDRQFYAQQRAVKYDRARHRDGGMSLEW